MKVEFVVSIFTYMSIHIATDALNVVFGNVSDKGRSLVAEDDGVRFITDIVKTIVRDNFCARVTIKGCTNRSPLDFLYGI